MKKSDTLLSLSGVAFLVIYFTDIERIVNIMVSSNISSVKINYLRNRVRRTDTGVKDQWNMHFATATLHLAQREIMYWNVFSGMVIHNMPFSGKFHSPLLADVNRAVFALHSSSRSALSSLFEN